MGYGINARLGIAFQDSYGTAVPVTSAHWLQFNSESVNLKKAELLSGGLRGIFDEAPTYEGLNTVDGEVAIEANAIDIGMMLRAVLGPPTTVQSGSIYTHTFKPSQSDWDDKCAIRPFTLFKYLGVGSGDSFFDLAGNTLELGCANGEFLMAKMGVVGGQYATAVLPTMSYFASTKMTWDVASLSIGDSAVDYGSDITITIDNKLEPKHTLKATKYPSYIKRTDYRMFSVGGTLRFESQAEKTAFLNQTERNLTLTFKTATAIASGYTETLSIILPAYRVLEHNDQAGGATDLEVPLNGKAKYFTNSATALQITLTNTRASYPS